MYLVVMGMRWHALVLNYVKLEWWVRIKLQSIMNLESLPYLIDELVDYFVVYPSSAVVLAIYLNVEMNFYHVLGNKWNQHVYILYIHNPRCFIWNSDSGCDQNRYSSNQCRTRCPLKCRNQNCDAFNGSCIYGCHDPKALTLDCIGNTVLGLQKTTRKKTYVILDAQLLQQNETFLSIF